MYCIREIKAREVFNSRGCPALEVEVITSDGRIGRAIAPSGASKGSLEACELIDCDEGRLAGRGLLKAIVNIRDVIAPALEGKSIEDQSAIDQLMIELDGTPNKSRLGGNALTAVSLAVSKAHAKVMEVPLCSLFNSLICGGKGDFTYYPPTPMLNVINGGMHADNRLAIQEFMICPVGLPTFRESMEKAAEIFHRLKCLLQQHGKSINVGDEGGFAPDLSNTEEVLVLIREAIANDAEYVKIALDAAASTFFENGAYNIDGKVMDTDGIIAFYSGVAAKYGIISIEDPVSESDWQAWQKVTSKLSEKMNIVGDDVFATNSEILSRGIADGVANAVLIKINQIGTITETVKTIKLAQENGYKVVISHRSGETEDVSIAHLAVACGGGTFLKAGSLSRSERVAKYNEVLRIEEMLS
ncbi:phosphopyruvate hydratase [Neorickettsia helminthoeca str. Oregon]|uniref:Enolase n=1 Tax=Neorickettsia helminthoeca str. Oregon TaxID=1286528 RepID=X5GX54_9RICK|nr:phosphopyruvate hydratase [Neorickettsia helminthoeca]AHX11627.1 phosphopyruvate hydratase [Neorickettsia helminthoeca str. Oregon]